MMDSGNVPEPILMRCNCMDLSMKLIALEIASRNPLRKRNSNRSFQRHYNFHISIDQIQED